MNTAAEKELQADADALCLAIAVLLREREEAKAMSEHDVFVQTPVTIDAVANGLECAAKMHDIDAPGLV